MSRTHPIARRPPTFRLPAVWPPAAAADDPCRRAYSRGTRPPRPASPRLPSRLWVWVSKVGLLSAPTPTRRPFIRGGGFAGGLVRGGTKSGVFVVAVPWYAAVPSGRVTFATRYAITGCVLRPAQSDELFDVLDDRTTTVGGTAASRKRLLDHLSVIVVTNCDNMRRQRCHPRWW